MHGSLKKFTQNGMMNKKKAIQWQFCGRTLLTNKWVQWRIARLGSYFEKAGLQQQENLLGFVFHQPITEIWRNLWHISVLDKQFRVYKTLVRLLFNNATTIHLSFCSVIPKVTKHLLSNPVFTCIVLAACMEIAVVAGFAAFLGKYLEQQFNLTTTSANQLLGMSDMLSSYEPFCMQKNINIFCIFLIKHCLKIFTNQINILLLKKLT